MRGPLLLADGGKEIQVLPLTRKFNLQGDSRNSHIKYFLRTKTTFSTFSNDPWFLLQDYVTEKLFEALQHNLLPVVLGKYALKSLPRIPKAYPFPILLVSNFISYYLFYIYCDIFFQGGTDYSGLLPAGSYINMREYPDLRQLGPAGQR
jgi:hypothetical protein